MPGWVFKTITVILTPTSTFALSTGHRPGGTAVERGCHPTNEERSGHVTTAALGSSPLQSRRVGGGEGWSVPHCEPVICIHEARKAIRISN